MATLFAFARNVPQTKDLFFDRAVPALNYKIIWANSNDLCCQFQIVSLAEKATNRNVVHSGQRFCSLSERLVTHLVEHKLF